MHIPNPCICDLMHSISVYLCQLQHCLSKLSDEVIFPQIMRARTGTACCGAKASCFRLLQICIKKCVGVLQGLDWSHHTHKIWCLLLHEETHPCSKQGHLVMSLKSFRMEKNAGQNDLSLLLLQPP